MPSPLTVWVASLSWDVGRLLLHLPILQMNTPRGRRKLQTLAKGLTAGERRTALSWGLTAMPSL